MKIKIILLVYIITALMVGCSREISSIRFYPQDIDIEETKTETQEPEEKLYFQLSYDNENYDNMNIVSEIETVSLKAENATVFNLKIPENASFNEFCLNGDVLYYAYDFSSYEDKFYGDNTKIDHTEELYTRLMSYNYITGETRCVYEIETPGVSISGLRVQGNIAVWREIFCGDMENIYGSSIVDEVLVNGSSITKIYNLDTGTIMEVEENSDNGYLVDLTSHPFLIYRDYYSKIYGYDFVSGESATLIEGAENYSRVYCSENVIAHVIDELEYKSVIFYDYNGDYLCTFKTNIYYINYVLVNDECIVFVGNDVDDNKVYIVYDQNTGEMYKVRYNPNVSNVVCDGSKIYSGDFGNSGIRVFDLESKTVSGDYYGDRAMEMYYSSTGGAYARIEQSEIIEDGNRIIEFVVFNE